MSDKKEKNKESPQSWWGLVILPIVLISIWLVWPAKKPQLVSAQPAVVEKTCPEDLARCEPCEGAKNFEWPLDKKGRPLQQLVVDVSATNCWTGYVITPKQIPFGKIIHEADQYVQFRDDNVTVLGGPARIPDPGKRRAIFRLMAKERPGKATVVMSFSSFI